MHFRHCPHCKLLAMSGEYCAGCGAHLHGPAVTGVTGPQIAIFITIVFAGLLIGFSLGVFGVFQETATLALTVTPAVTACTGTISYTATLTTDAEPEHDVRVTLLANGQELESLRTDRNGRITSSIPFQQAWCGTQLKLTALADATTRRSAASATQELRERIPVRVELTAPATTAMNTPTPITVRATDAYDGTALRGVLVRLQAGQDEKYLTTNNEGTAEFVLTTATTQTLQATVIGDERYGRTEGTPVTITVAQPTLATRVALLQTSVVGVSTPWNAGSGVIIERTATQTTILTNRHVVEGATTSDIRVTTDENENAGVTSITLAPGNLDLALITTRPLGNVATISDSLPDRGEPVIAIGNPLGLAGSVSRGIVSNTINTQTGEGVSYTVIQTDAAVNPGNSGGGLFTEDTGALVGIVSAKRFDAEGIGFAIAINALELFEN